MVQAIGQLEFSRHNNQQSIQCFQIEHRSRSDPIPQNPPKSFIQWFHIYVHKSPSKQWFTIRGKGLYDGHGSRGFEANFEPSYHLASNRGETQKSTWSGCGEVYGERSPLKTW